MVMRLQVLGPLNAFMLYVYLRRVILLLSLIYCAFSYSIFIHLEP
jgi:hypothetical protein